MYKNRSDQFKDSNNAENEHWPGISKIWNQVGPPLRPSEQDLNFITKVIESGAVNNNPPRVLILGVTPEFYHLPWPDGSKILAADHTQGMIDAVWPGPKEDAICSDWTTLPIDPESQDIILCDGGLHLLSYPEGQQKLISKIHQLLSPNGISIFRLFAPPEKFQSSETILNDLLDGKIANLNLLKLRLWMALLNNNKDGVSLNDIWNLIHQISPDFEQLALKINWPLEHLLSINTYKNSSKRYYFSTLDDVLQLFSRNPGGFKIENINSPSYELGECCPTIVMKKINLKIFTE